MKKQLFLTALCGILLFSFLKAAPTSVIYPSSNPRFAEYIEILHTALDKSSSMYGPCTLRAATEEMNEARYFIEVISGKNVNVVWGATSVEREAYAIPIKIPLAKGLLGYRIGLIHSDLQSKFSQVKTPKELSNFVFGLGIGWGEVPIYRSAGFQVIESNYDNLFKMLNAGRIDFLSRGINEIWDEFDFYSQDNPNISIENTLLLHSVFPYYFFVTPKDKKLAERIEFGMRQMLKDGSYDAIFLKYNKEAINRAQLDKRRIIEIINPNLPLDTPKDPELWYSPQK